MTCPHEPSNDSRPIAEGICPTCRVALDRHDDHGLCPCCGIGWSMTSDEVRMHFEVRGFEMVTSFGRIIGGPGRAVATKATP